MSKEYFTSCAKTGVWSEKRQTELLWVVAETKLDPGEHDAVSLRLRDALKAQGIAVDHVRLVGAGTLPKTTSGKIRRADIVVRLRHELADSSDTRY